MIAPLSDETMRLRSLIAEIVEARDREDFEGLMAAIDEARSETILMAMHGLGLSPIAKPLPATPSPQGQAAAPQAPEAKPRNSDEDDPAEAGSGTKRILIATIALFVILVATIGAHGVWTGQPFPAPR